MTLFMSALERASNGGSLAINGKAVETACGFRSYLVPAVNGWSKNPAGKPPEGG